ncbi:hypothetical protein [Aquihabitans sp. McL0605]|uniref:hypothetical protein n=1 Tax=Aquihabitans sp. McL0605 TaxID=3415671 RepID=UPI003CF1EF26
MAVVTSSALYVMASPASAPAAGASVSTDVVAACNNTFQPTKFPLTYKVVSTPSANPVAAGSTFTVDFQVSMVVSADFLNGLYNILGSVEVPITKNKVTIGPLAGATGAAVQANMAATFTIPAPAAIPVANGVTIPIGTVTGTFTATSGTAKFGIQGNSWAPTDTKPAGVTEYGWSGTASNVILTTTGARTYAQASLAGGVIKPFLVCMGGSWTKSGADYVPPLIAPVGFGNVTISSATTSTTGGGTTSTTGGGTTSTTSGGTTSTTTGGTTSTTADATTSTTADPTTSTTADPTTSTTADPTTSTTAPTETTTTNPPPSQTEVSGASDYPSQCSNDITSDKYAITFNVAGTTSTNIRSGDVLDVVDQEWKVTIPGDLLSLVSGVAGTDSVDALVTTGVAGKNTAPALANGKPLHVVIGPIVTVGGVTQPLTITFKPGDVRFQATGGNAEFRMGKTTLVVTLNDALKVTLVCEPDANTQAFVVSVVAGPPIATTTTTAPAADPPSSGGTAAGSSGSGSDGGTLARTGVDGHSLVVELLAGLLMIQVGYLLWSAVAPPRPPRARTA